MRSSDFARRERPLGFLGAAWELTVNLPPDNPLVNEMRLRNAKIVVNRSEAVEWRPADGLTDHERKLANKKAYQKAKRAYHRLTKRGISSEWVEEMLSAQEWCCAICGSEIDDSACADHDHSTAAARGMLCSSCNTGLGFFRDSPDFLRGAAEYIEDFA